MVIVKNSGKFFQRENFFIALRRAPAKKRDEIYHCFRQESLLNQIFIGGMAAPLAQFVMFLVGNKGTMHIHGNLPAKSLIKPVIFGRRRKILVSPDHMGNPH
jgi:hypothetical protein